MLFSNLFARFVEFFLTPPPPNAQHQVISHIKVISHIYQPQHPFATYCKGVPEGGLEPPRPCGQRILSPLRSPLNKRT